VANTAAVDGARIRGLTCTMLAADGLELGLQTLRSAPLTERRRVNHRPRGAALSPMEHRGIGLRHSVGSRKGVMASHDLPGGTYRVGALELTRVGYGAMQLAGPGVFGPPKDRDAAIAVLREAVELGIRHIDTADFYGPQVTNELIREALAPYPDDLHIVTKVGARRDEQGGWPHARTPAELRGQVHDNLRRLGLEVLDVVNMRVGGFDAPEPGSLAEQFETLAELQQQGLIRHLGVSTVSADQLAEAQTIAPVVCVQNFYNIARREDDALVDLTAQQGIAYVPYFPLGGFSPLQSDALGTVAERVGATPMSVALAWLLQRSPNMLLIPGTSSVAHLRENIAGAGLALPPDTVAELDAIGH
jgi:pyridoxine 4-dehydrogenase